MFVKLMSLGDAQKKEIDEPGSKLLTTEFLCTLKPTDSEVSFRLFGKDFSIPWK
jgi:hypothetical protein